MDLFKTLKGLPAACIAKLLCFADDMDGAIQCFI